jgi:hypothetical protein
MNIGYFFNDDNANIDWLDAALFKSLYVYKCTHLCRKGQWPDSSENIKKRKRICRTIKVNILVVRMIFDTRNGGWSLDQNVIIYPYTFSLYIEMYCSYRSITFFLLDYIHTTLIFHLVRIDEQEELLSSHGTMQTINRRNSFFFE